MDSRGDQSEKFLQAYDNYADALFRHCFFKTSDKEVAADLTQQTFLKTWHYIKKGKKVADFRPFLYRTANNLIIDWYRKRKEESLDIMTDGGFEISNDDQETQLNTAEFSLTLNALAKLADKDKDIIILYYIEDLPIKEIAFIIGANEKTTSVKIHRAIKKLRKILHLEDDKHRT